MGVCSRQSAAEPSGPLMDQTRKKATPGRFGSFTALLIDRQCRKVVPSFVSLGGRLSNSYHSRIIFGGSAALLSAAHIQTLAFLAVRVGNLVAMGKSRGWLAAWLACSCTRCVK